MSSNPTDFLEKRNQEFTQKLAKTGRALPRRWMRLVFVCCAALVIPGVLVIVLSLPPRDFAVGQRIHVKEGSSLGSIAKTLQENSITRSRTFFEVLASVSGEASRLKAGEYIFEHPISTRQVLQRIAGGDYGDVALRLTILEGATLNDIAQAAAGVLDGFEVEKFIDDAIEFNGYLFPDTYFILPSTTTDELVEQMHDQFSAVFNEVGSDMLNTISPERLREVVIMASIIEREAAGAHDSYTISGILWKRIEIGMPLQVDASFAYLFDKDSSQVTRSDMAFDSPYNTYKYAGLPPGPLGNPGKVALDAALHPASSPYLFYLHDKNGGVHYGKNLDEHNANKRKYLR